MTISVIVALVVIGVIAVAVRSLRSDPHADVDRFHQASEITSSWSIGYAPASEPEQPEAAEERYELQHSVHLVDA